MNELKRQAYLQAMEVDYYLPRLKLPGARASSLCELPVSVLQLSHLTSSLAQQQPPHKENYVVGTDVENTTASTITERKSNSAMHALFDVLQEDSSVSIVRNSNSVQKEVADSNSEVKTESKSIGTQEIPHFSLSIIRGSNVFLIDDGLSNLVDKKAYLRLVQNMLFAIGATIQQLSVDQFHWPMVKNSQVDQSKTAAQQTLESFLNKQIQLQETKYLLIMGETAKTYLTEESNSKESNLEGRFISHQQLNTQIIYTASIMRSLEYPSIKRQIWQDLQPLNRVLRKS